MFRSFAVVLLIAVTLSFIYPTLEAPILVKRIINSTTATISSLPNWRSSDQDITIRGNRLSESEIEDFRHRPSPPSDTAPSRGWEPIYMPQEPQAPQAVAREEDIDRETFSSHPNPDQPNPPSRGWEPVYTPASDDKQQPVAKREEPENPAVAKFLQRQRQMPVPPPEEDPSYNAQQPLVSEQQKQQSNEDPEIDAFKQRPSEPTPNPPSRGWAPVYKPSGEHPADM
ncbi:hypothetical protein CCMSSC00406_0005975 [Pleurotus cornucopiae]|uniref:Uncharacterized protein n=1 Tax=Pleurotus cornucopiae TaxID=5321 RepID=A0ACB7IQA3_PLECO|nr:hypothetical protein CCMSSC00406_0005975 [Pleurotus cornucopiae]